MRWAMSEVFAKGLFACVLVSWLSWCNMVLAADSQLPDAAGILAASDKARGGGLPGIEWNVQVVTVKPDRDTDSIRLKVKSNGDDNLMEILAPAKARGRKILMRHNNMWFYSPSVRKPVPISPRQRLTGQASYGDVAATNYVRDYSAKLLGEKDLDGKPCYVLDLTAVNKTVTYDKIKYWVARESGLGVKAEFYTLSGKLIKTATFQYDNKIDYDSHSIPFVSQMRITDALSGNAVTTLTYSGIEARPLSARDFQLN